MACLRPSRLGVLAIAFLSLMTPAAVNAAPVTYKIAWDLAFADEGPYWITYSDDPLGAPATTFFSFDRASEQFGTFVVDWWGIEFDFGTLMNDLLAPADRSLVAEALLTPEDNGWYGGTHSHDSPKFYFRIDAPGLAPFALRSAAGDLLAHRIVGGEQTLFHSLPVDFVSPECGEAPTGCSAGGDYRVTRVPEPSTLALIAFGTGGILLRGRRRG